MGRLTALDSPPGRAAPHLVADFVELMCAASADGEWGVPDLTALRKRKDKDGATVLAVSERELILAEDDPGEEDLSVALAAALEVAVAADAVVEEEVVDDNAPANTAPGPTAADDSRSVEASEIVGALEYRAERFGEVWPFELYDEDNLRLRASLTDAQRLYLALLLSSCLSHLSRTDSNAMTKDFERLAPATLRGYLGSRAEAHLFGTTKTLGSRYTGTLWEKVVALGEDLKVTVVGKKEEVEANTGGDFGLDAVAWIPTGDSSPTMLTAFAQCACGKRWKGKQQEASEASWSPILSFRSPVVNMTLIPYSFRNADGTWAIDAHVQRGIVLDRERIVDAIAASSADLATLVPTIIDDFVGELG